MMKLNAMWIFLALSVKQRVFSQKFWATIFLTLFALTGCSAPSANSPAGNATEEVSASLPFSENSTIFEIVAADSEARFLIDEILHGEEKRVIGRTNQVSGQIAFDFADPSTAAAGPIEVNARTLETDNGIRNRAIQNRILLSNIYEHITFRPTAVIGLPDKIVTGETVEFELEIL